MKGVKNDMKSYVFIAMVICSIIIYPFEAKSQDSGDLRIKSVTLVDGTVISAQNYAATDAAAIFPKYGIYRIFLTARL